MLSVYPGIFIQDKQGRVSVIFPDLNHLATFGDGMQEAMEMAVDCLAGYIHSEKKTAMHCRRRPLSRLSIRSSRILTRTPRIFPACSSVWFPWMWRNTPRRTLTSLSKKHFPFRDGSMMRLWNGGSIFQRFSKTR